MTFDVPLSSPNQIYFLNFQLILFNLCGFFFFLSSGSLAIDAYKEFKGVRLLPILRSITVRSVHKKYNELVHLL